MSANVQFWSCWFTDFSEYKTTSVLLQIHWNVCGCLYPMGGLIAWDGMEGTN